MSYQSDRTTVKRIPKRGHYDTETIYSILDSQFICHVGFIYDGIAMMIPTMYGRKENKLFLHGAASSRMLETIVQQEISIAVTLLDSLVLAKSMFHHSLNYRSGLLIGKAVILETEEEKTEGLRIISDHMLPGRWEEGRQPTSNELKATNVLSFSISEASAKIRNEGVNDDPRDHDFPVWSGIVPLETKVGDPITAKESEDILLPDYIQKKVGQELL